MASLRVLLKANHFRLTYRHAISVLRELVRDLPAVEPVWVMVAEALDAPVVRGDHRPDGVWSSEAKLRPDTGALDDHLTVARTFAQAHPAWLLELRLGSAVTGLGDSQTGIVLLQTAEFLRVLPQLFVEGAPAVWARSWPDVHAAAMDFDRLDPCCDGMAGYYVELLRGSDTRSHNRQRA